MGRTLTFCEGKEMPRTTYKYKKKFCKELIDHFSKDFEEQYKEEVVAGKDGVIKKLTKRRGAGCPSLYGFAAKIGVHRDTLTDWSNKHPEFKLAFDRAKALQADFIIQNASRGLTPQPFAIFMMKNNHGWKDKVEQKVEGGDRPLEVTFRRWTPEDKPDHGDA